MTSAPGDDRVCGEPRATVCRWWGDRRGALSFTFDDGYQGAIERAVRPLEAAGWRCTYAVPTGFVGRDLLPDPPCAAEPAASWDDLSRLAAAGHEVCSHSVSHPELPTLDDDALRRELVDSQRALTERLGGPPGGTLVYPFGRFDERCSSLAAETYTCARGTRLRLCDPSVEELYRTDGALIQRGMTCKHLARWLEQCLEERAWLIEAYHAVVTEDHPLWTAGYTYCWSDRRVREHLGHVRALEADLWVATHEQVASYVRQRERSELRCTPLGADRFALSARLADERSGAAPLTVALEAPPGRTLELEDTPGAAARLLVDVAPGQPALRFRLR